MHNPLSGRRISSQRRRRICSPIRSLLIQVETIYIDPIGLGHGRDWITFSNPTRNAFRYWGGTKAVPSGLSWSYLSSEFISADSDVLYQPNPPNGGCNLWLDATTMRLSFCNLPNSRSCRCTHLLGPKRPLWSNSRRWWIEHVTHCLSFL